MAKLGSKKKPARGHVQTLERAQAILAMCDDRGWTAIIGIEPDKPEDISEVQRILNPPKPNKQVQRLGGMTPVHVVAVKNSRNAAWLSKNEFKGDV